MIRANIAELKNKLSHYLRLVKGGEVIEIMDRTTPLARISALEDSMKLTNKAPWVKKIHDVGIISLPRKKKVSSDFSDPRQAVLVKGKKGGVLKALLEEREAGR